MKRAILYSIALCAILFLAGHACGQSFEVSPDDPGAPTLSATVPNSRTVQPEAVLPQNWIGSGSGYNPSGSPKLTAWTCTAILTSKTAQAYSFTCYDIIPAMGKLPTSSLTTGIAIMLRRFGPVSVLGFGTGGMAQGATTLTGAIETGGLAVWQFKNGFTIVGTALFQRGAGSSDAVYRLGVGWSF